MSSWIAYSIYPDTGVEPEQLQSCISDSVTDSAVEASRFGREKLKPEIKDKWGCVGRRCSTSTGTKPTFESELVDWLEQCADCIDVVFMVQMNDATDFGTIRVYKPSEYGLVEVEEASGEYFREKDILEDYENNFPEEAAQLVPRNNDTDHIRRLESGYGHRPLIFYG